MRETGSRATWRAAAGLYAVSCGTGDQILTRRFAVRTLFCVGLLLVASSCALRQADSPATTQTEEVIEAPPDAVWRVLPEVYATLGLEVTESDSQQQLIASTRALSVWGPLLGPPEAPHARCTLPALYRTLSALGGPGTPADRVPVTVPPGRVMF
jgi:hypothetical protein